MSSIDEYDGANLASFIYGGGRWRTYIRLKNLKIWRNS